MPGASFKCLLPGIRYNRRRFPWPFNAGATFKSLRSGSFTGGVSIFQKYGSPAIDTLISFLKIQLLFLLGSLRGAPVVFVLCALVFSAAWSALYVNESYAEEPEETVNINPHDFNDKNNCGVCHTAEPPKLNVDPVTTCSKCHLGNAVNHPVARHPLGIAPRINMPRFLPLSSNGQIVCYTCHDHHNKSKHPKMLRVDYIRLCNACHAGY